MNENPKDFLKKCLELYSPSGNEIKYAIFLANFLKQHGFKVKFDDIGNLIAEKGSGKPLLLMISHMDTIPGELPVFEKEGKLYGRGAVDCKSALAAMVYAISVYDFNKNPPGKIVFAGIVREETSLEGILEFLKLDFKPDYAIFGEPTKTSQICIGYKGRLSLCYKIITKPGHIASSWMHLNAIEVALTIWEKIKEISRQFTGEVSSSSEVQKYYKKIVPNLSTIAGGELANVIPSKCTIQVDIRFPPSVNSNIILKHIRKSNSEIINAHSKQHPELKIQEEILSQIEGFEVKGDDILTGALRWAIFKVRKSKPILVKKTGTTFINLIGNPYGIPSITYGPGDPKLEHSEREFVDIEEYLETIEVYLKLFEKLQLNYSKTTS
ncbi:MAG: M20/M25/M40 family metallo-hydrolase [Promethearchaeota archaeon]